MIPALNEAEALGPVVAGARRGAAEVIVADGGSRDDTAAVARRAGARVVTSVAGRGRQLNAGAACATGDLLVFLHADTRLPDGFETCVRRLLADEMIAAGAFRLSIDAPARRLRMVERAVNWRSRRLGLPWGDQGIFVRAATFRQVGGFPDVAAMEDFVLVRRLRRCGRIAIADEAVTTSARRWLGRGIIRTTLLNQACIAAYLGGVSPDRIATWRDPPASRPVGPSGRGVSAGRRIGRV